MEHFYLRQPLSRVDGNAMADRRFRFLQIDVPPMARGEVICPQPHRASRFPFPMETVNRAIPMPNSLVKDTAFWHWLLTYGGMLSSLEAPVEMEVASKLPVYRSDSTPDVLDLILSKSDPDGDTDSTSQVGFCGGSPPVRTNNPVIHDPQFGRTTPPFSPLGSSLGKKPVGRVELASPWPGSPKARIEGFACGNSERHCAFTFA